MLLFSYLLAAPMVAAGLLHNKPVCGTTTRTCTEVTKVPGPTPVTSSCTVWGNCWATVTRTDNECKTAWTTITTTQTRTPVVTVTGTPTRTVTCTKLVPSNVCINNWARDVSLIPDDVTNAERIKLGLPLRSIQEERRFFHLGPSCTPTTITTTTTSTCTTPWVTKVTSTKCGWTKTSVIPNTATVTKTRTECTTVPGTITSTYTKPCVAPTTTTVTRTTTRKVIC